MKQIIILIAAILAFTSCGRDWYCSESVCLHICPDNSSYDLIYNGRIYGKDSEQWHIEVTRDTILYFSIDFVLPSYVNKDEKMRQDATLRRLSGEGECDIYMLTTGTVKYKGEEYHIVNLIDDVIWHNDTSLMPKEELNELIKGASSKFSLSAGEDIITVPITYLR